jgi:hypothetical protein
LIESAATFLPLAGINISIRRKYEERYVFIVPFDRNNLGFTIGDGKTISEGRNRPHTASA